MKRKGLNRAVDAGLMAGFVAAFFPAGTGLPLHQGLGVLLGGLAAWHLFLHWGWCKAVSMRFFKRVPRRTRGCYLIDAGLMVGFLLILGSGILISTWLDLSLRAYRFWVDLHGIAAYAVLALLAVKMALKLGLLRRWGAASTPRQPGIGEARGRSAWGTPEAAKAQKMKPASCPIAMSRRQALALMGMAGIAGPLAFRQRWLEREPLAAASPPEKRYPRMRPAAPPVSTPARGRSDGAPRQPDHGGPLGETTVPQAKPVSSSVPESFRSPAETEVAASQAGIRERTATPVASSDPPAANVCSVRCNRKCSYPGRCRLYADANGNGLCDLGECL